LPKTTTKMFRESTFFLITQQRPVLNSCSKIRREGVNALIKILPRSAAFASGYDTVREPLVQRELRRVFYSKS
jgi:hypothetical protein